MYVYFSEDRGGCWEGEQKRFSLGNRIIQEVPHQAYVLVWSIDDLKFIKLESENFF